MAMWGTVLSETPEGGLVGRAGGEGLYEGHRFWADAIKDTYDDPRRRLEMATRNLPLPAAFREAAIALRAIIRNRRKLAKPFEKDLAEPRVLKAQRFPRLRPGTRSAKAGRYIRSQRTCCSWTRMAVPAHT